MFKFILNWCVSRIHDATGARLAGMYKTIRYVVFSEAGGWIAQGVDKDICSQGATITEALDRFKKTVCLEKDHGNYDAIPKAPEEYLLMYQSIKRP